MTVTADLRPAGTAQLRPSPALAAFAAGCLLAAVAMAPQAWSVWMRGTFLDPDDAMRAVEVRDFLGGQGWFDLVPHRLSPDHPFTMHWSRLVDVPLAMLVQVFGVWLSPEFAERAMRIVEPAVLFGLLLATVLDLVRRLAGPRATLPAAAAIATNPQLVTNFLPGHIHHHGLQATLLMGAVAALLRALSPERRGDAACLAGALAAVSLGVGLQNLPFVIGLAAVAAAAWIVEGARQAHTLRGFAAGLGAAVPVFLLDVPPGHYAAGSCDAFSVAHLVAAGATAAAFLLLASLSGRLRGRGMRALAAVGGGAAVLALLAATYPACLHDPMNGVDPLLRTEWLSGVGEALPLARLIALSWPEGLMLLVALLTGLGATALAASSASVADRPRWLALLLLGSIGFAGALWQVRVAASTGALLVPGISWLALRMFDHVSRRPGAPALLAAALLVAFGSGAAPAALARPLAALNRSDATGPAPSDPATCSDPASLAPLAALPPGLVLSTIDPGSAILAFTPHAVLAAPYHRDTSGIRTSVLVLAAPPEAAWPLIREARVRYLALCRTSNETSDTISRHPDSLSADLLAGRVPAWLQPVGGAGGVYRLFEVRPEG